MFPCMEAFLPNLKNAFGYFRSNFKHALTMTHDQLTLVFSSPIHIYGISLASVSNTQLFTPSNIIHGLAQSCILLSQLGAKLNDQKRHGG